MTLTAETTVSTRPAGAVAAGRARPARSRPTRDFWASRPAPNARGAAIDPRHEMRELVARLSESPGVAMFDAIEAGVPTHVVHVIARATGQPLASVIELIGVPPTTFRRKDEANQRLPDAAGHRVMGFLRVVATLRRLLEESGDPKALESFDLETWVASWMREPLPELGGNTPAAMLRNPEGQRAVEQVLERMRGGLVG